MRKKEAKPAGIVAALFRSRFEPRLLSTLYVTAVLGLVLLIPTTTLAALFHDDAYYYLTIARNLAAGRGSTFDGVTVTTGYHPAQLGLLWALGNLFPKEPSALVRAACVLHAALTGLGISLLSGLIPRDRAAWLAALIGVSLERSLRDRAVAKRLLGRRSHSPLAAWTSILR